MMNQDATAAWKDMSQRWTDAWAQAMGGKAAPSDPFSGFWAPIQPLPPDAAQPWQRMLEQYVRAWTELWSKGPAGPPSAESIRAAEKLWMDQLESMAKVFSQSMASESFASTLGKSMEQSLAWQQRYMEAVNPQIDSALRDANISSRAQIDRLLERLIGLEERLDDLEDQNREILTLLETRREADSSKEPPVAAKPARSTASRSTSPPKGRKRGTARAAGK